MLAIGEGPTKKQMMLDNSRDKIFCLFYKIWKKICCKSSL